MTAGGNWWRAYEIGCIQVGYRRRWRSATVPVTMPTVEVTATTEKPVVSKQAHVVEEVALSKQSGQREETVSGTVRRQDVKVEEVDRKAGSSKKS